MNHRMTFLLALALSGIYGPAFASIRVGNGELPSLDFICDPDEAIGPWCEAFESAAKISPFDLKEGNQVYFAHHADFLANKETGVLRIFRQGKTLSYAWIHAHQSESALLKIVSETPLRSLSEDPSYLEFLDIDINQRIVFRKSRSGKLVARTEILSDPFNNIYLEENYELFAPPKP